MTSLVRVAAAALLAALTVVAGSGAPATAATPAGPLVAAGTPITGTNTRVDAPAVAEGVWLDSLGGVGGDRQTLYYRVERRVAESTLHVSVTTPLGTESDSIAVEVLTAENVRCASETDSGAPALDDGAVIAASVWLPRTRDAADRPCAAAGDFVVKVDHGFATTGRRADVPIELRVQEEPPVRSVDSLPETAATPAWKDPRLAGATERLVGGRALNAARVTAPGAYLGSIRTGESQVFAVPLDFGQSLAAALRLKVATPLAARLASGGPTMSVRLLAPSRLDAAGGSDYDTDAPDHRRGSATVLSSSDGMVVHDYTDTVSYRNRYATTDSQQGAAERGRYLVVVSLLDRSGDSAVVTVPFVLGVAVRGEVADAPEYTVTDTADVDAAQTGAGGSGDLVRRIGGIAALALGVLALAGGSLLLVRRRRSRLP